MAAFFACMLAVAGSSFATGQPNVEGRHLKVDKGHARIVSTTHLGFST